MSATDFAKMTDDARRSLNNGLPIDMTSELEGRVSLYEYDEVLRCTVETTPDGHQYIVRLVNNQMLRLRELVALVPVLATA